MQNRGGPVHSHHTLCAGARVCTALCGKYKFLAAAISTHAYDIYLLAYFLLLLSLFFHRSSSLPLLAVHKLLQHIYIVQSFFITLFACVVISLICLHLLSVGLYVVSLLHILLAIFRAALLSVSFRCICKVLLFYCYRLLSLLCCCNRCH